MNDHVKRGEKLIMGLDIGSNSIGWALIAAKGGKPTRFIDVGVRIFNKSVKDKPPTPKNKKRRDMRLARRVIQRRARRKRRIEAYLIKLGLLPAELATTEKREGILNTLGDPYELRAKGLDKKLEPFEIGRVLLHLVQRRGFLSNRKSVLGDLVNDPDVLAILEEDAEEKKTDTEESQFKQEIENLRQAIENSGYRTLGEYLYKSEDLSSKRNRRRNGGDLRTDRSMYMDELDKIWKVQEKFHDVLDQSVRKQIGKIIFFQRPIKLNPDRVGKCSLETRNNRCAKARLEYQEFRYLQDVNNLAYIDPYTDEVTPISHDKIQRIVPLFEDNKNVTYAKIRKALGFDKSYTFNLEEAENKKLKGNLSSLFIAEVFPAWKDYNEEAKINLMEDLLSIKKKSALRCRLLNHWNCKPEEAIALCLLEFEEGYANHSLKAIKKLLPYMRKGKRYDEARIEAGYGYEKDESEPLEKLPSPPQIPNPIVVRGLNEVRKLVNAVIKTYGKPDIFRVEMARDLEMNTKRYKQFVRRQKLNTKANEEAEKEWNKISKANPRLKMRKYPSRDDKIKYRLWEDQRQLCAYSCKPISMAQLFSDNTEIDHIIPYSFSIDDSYMNKVICFTKENREKERRTPIDAFGANEIKWDNIKSAIDKWHKSLRSKKERFYKRKQDIEKDFSASQLVDTRYISREALAYFKLLGSDVTTTKGIMTSWLRSHWDLNSLVSEVDEKDRSDHRQHVIDAAITACIDRSFYQNLARLAKKIEQSSSGVTMRDLHTDEPWSGFRDQLGMLVENLPVSHQTSSKIQGHLHEETGVGFNERIGATVYRKDVGPDLKLDSIVDRTVRDILEKHLDRHNGDRKVAFSSENPVFHKDGKTPIKRVRVKQSKVTMKDLEKNKFAIKDRKGEPFKWHSYGNIHSVSVFYDGEKKQYLADFLTVAEAKRHLWREVDNQITSNAELKFTLYKNDAVWVSINGKRELFRVQQIKFTNRKIVLIKNYCAKKNSNSDVVEITLNDKNIRTYELEKARVNVIGKLIQ